MSAATLAHGIFGSSIEDSNVERNHRTTDENDMDVDGGWLDEKIARLLVENQVSGDEMDDASGAGDESTVTSSKKIAAVGGKSGATVACDANVAQQQSVPNSVKDIVAKASKRISFPCLLYSMLEDAHEHGFAGIVSWNAQGTAFKVHRVKPFADTILPRYFHKQTKYKSFLRQLSMYGFHRVGHGDFKGVRSHPDFVRGDVGKCRRMRPISRLTVSAAVATGQESYPSLDTDALKVHEVNEMDLSDANPTQEVSLLPSSDAQNSLINMRAIFSCNAFSSTANMTPGSLPLSMSDLNKKSPSPKSPPPPEPVSVPSVTPSFTAVAAKCAQDDNIMDLGWVDHTMEQLVSLLGSTPSSITFHQCPPPPNVMPTPGMACYRRDRSRFTFVIAPEGSCVVEQVSPMLVRILYKPFRVRRRNEGMEKVEKAND